jgi:hypothetical protein
MKIIAQEARKIIQRRLDLAGGECLITVRSLARQICKRLNIEVSNVNRAMLYRTVKDEIERVNHKKYGQSSKPRKNRRNARNPVSSQIYHVTRS